MICAVFPGKYNAIRFNLEIVTFHSGGFEFVFGIGNLLAGSEKMLLNICMQIKNIMMRERIMTINKNMASMVLATGLCVGMSAAAKAEVWDMPLAYSGSNFHSVTAAEFGQCVTTGTGGAIEIVTHPSGSLIKGADIKRAVQTGQVPNRGKTAFRSPE
jgi:hypothetical protein